MDEDGFFYVLDRKKDMIIRSGLKVYPAKVERVLVRARGRRRRRGDRPAGPVHTEIVVRSSCRRIAEANREALIDGAQERVPRAPGAVRSAGSSSSSSRFPRSPLGKALEEGAAPDAAPTLTTTNAAATVASDRWTARQEGDGLMVALIGSEPNTHAIARWPRSSAGVRTPFVKMGGALRDVHVTDLAKDGDPGDALPRRLAGRPARRGDPRQRRDAGRRGEPRRVLRRCGRASRTTCRR